jgi:hypothetical protein
MATPSLTKMSFTLCLSESQLPTKDDLVVAAAGFGAHCTLWRRRPLLQVMAKDIAECDWVARGTSGLRAVAFKDTIR